MKIETLIFGSCLVGLVVIFKLAMLFMKDKIVEKRKIKADLDGSLPEGQVFEGLFKRLFYVGQYEMNTIIATMLLVIYSLTTQEAWGTNDSYVGALYILLLSTFVSMMNVRFDYDHKGMLFTHVTTLGLAALSFLFMIDEIEEHGHLESTIAQRPSLWTLVGSGLFFLITVLQRAMVEAEPDTRYYAPVSILDFLVLFISISITLITIIATDGALWPIFFLLLIPAYTLFFNVYYVMTRSKSTWVYVYNHVVCVCWIVTICISTSFLISDRSVTQKSRATLYPYTFCLLLLTPGSLRLPNVDDVVILGSVKSLMSMNQ